MAEVTLSDVEISYLYEKTEVFYKKTGKSDVQVYGKIFFYDPPSESDRPGHERFNFRFKKEDVDAQLLSTFPHEVDLLYHLFEVFNRLYLKHVINEDKRKRRQR